MEVSKLTLDAELKNKTLSKGERYRLTAERFNKLTSEDLSKAKSRKDVAALLGYLRETPSGAVKVGKMIRDGYLDEVIDTSQRIPIFSYYRKKMMPTKIKRKKNQLDFTEHLKQIQENHKNFSQNSSVHGVKLTVKTVDIEIAEITVNNLASLIRLLS